MTSGFEVDVEQLHRHGGRIAEVASTVGSAAAAGRTTGLVGSAFGVMCAPIGTVVAGFEAAIDHAMRATVDELDSSAYGVRAMVTAYRATDERAVASLRRLTP